MSRQPIIADIDGKREFACSAVGLNLFIVNEEERILLLSSPNKGDTDTWTTVSGALEEKETILEGSLREIREEIGSDVIVKPLGTIHAYTFHYDENVQYMIGICYLLAYVGGRIEPGDDMRGSQHQWWSLEEIEESRIQISPPIIGKWLLKRVIDLYRLWNDEEISLEQLGIEPLE